MPIRKEERERYPVNWRAISDRIRFDRAGGRCECRGECGYDHGYRIQGGVIPGEGGGPLDEPLDIQGDRCVALHGHPHPVTHSKVVLTVAHLDHTPENCDDSNIKAMCQRCHLSYDKEHHAATRAERLGGAE